VPSIQSMQAAKKRQFRRKILEKIASTYTNNRCNLWNTIKDISPVSHGQNIPSPDEFYNMFRNLALPRDACYFDYGYENYAIAFLDMYDNTPYIENANSLKLELLNDNFTIDEISRTIEQLKNNKSPGLDSIPSEFLKLCKDELIGVLTDSLNYIIEQRDFPDVWAEGLRTPVFKCGKLDVSENYRGITVLSVFAKIFETAVNNRLIFVGDAFEETDEFNGGFLKGSRTTDNIFILQGLINKQMFLGKPLFLCMVDFSKAFDLINRHILFYKLTKHGYHGRIIDTLRSLYRKTLFRVKCNGMLSSPVLDQLGVNQGGNASPTLFRAYVADIGEYLEKHTGLCVSDTIMAHLLWADDLVLISDSEQGIQKQLDGLLRYCSNNLMIVNEIKTKVLAFGTRDKIKVYFQGKPIEQVQSYKYLGNILTSVYSATGDIFSKNYDYLSGQARKAIFSIQKRTKALGPLPPRIQIHLYNSLIRPILLYGSDVWGVRADANKSTEKIFFQFMRCVLQVKATTSNLIVIGECGELPPSILCHINVLCFMKRLQCLPENKLVKQVFNEINIMHTCGVKTWVTYAYELAEKYCIDMNSDVPDFKQYCKVTVSNDFKQKWCRSVMDIDKHPILRTYSLFKKEFGREKYLDYISDTRFRVAMAKLRCSSHILEIERGRYTKPKTDINNRLCPVCNVVEDELHFLIDCNLYIQDRIELFNMIGAKIHYFNSFCSLQKFLFLMNNSDSQINVRTGKFIFKSFKIRRDHLNRCGNIE